jgi:hypothetical protein
MLPLLLSLACTADPKGGVVHGRAGSVDDTGDTSMPGTTDSGTTDSGTTDSGTPADDTGTTDSGTTGTSPEPTGCARISSVRARCGLANAADWALSTLEATEAGDGGIVLAASGLTSGTDTSGAYNGGDYAYGVVTSPVFEPGIAFDAVVPSWNADTPPGSWISVQISARMGGSWTGWYRMGVWASGTSDLDRHSFDGEEDANGTVYTDTLVLNGTADALRVRATMFTADGVTSPTLRRLTVALASSDEVGVDAGGEAWGVSLDVPQRSQMVFDEGESWCSPTSTSMLMKYWADQTGRSALDVTVPEAADGTWDAVYEGNGNWPFNVAYAASRGLTGEVGWFGAVSDLEPWIAAGVPVAISAAWGRGELDNAPISSTNGHLLVVTGFTSGGDVEVNDPASPSDDTVARVYDREQFANAWLGGSGGVAYLLWDGGERPVP